jgi:MFS family permease
MLIVSFVDSGKVANDLEAQRIYQKITLIAMMGTAVALPLLGHFSDKVGAHITVPIAFLSRALVLTSFLYISDPDSIISYLLCSLIIITSAMQSSSVEVLFLKTVPKEIRGAMVGFLNLFANIGTLLFTHYGGPAFDKIGPTSPFIIIACGDWIVAVLAISLVTVGLLN